MKAITIKQIPDPIYFALKERAAANHRSMNKEIIAMLEQSANASGAGVENEENRRRKGIELFRLAYSPFRQRCLGKREKVSPVNIGFLSHKSDQTAVLM